MNFDYAEKADPGESQIVRYARMFDEASNDLDNLKAQQRKIGEAVKAAQEKMNEAASGIRSCLDITTVAAEARRLP